MIKHKRVSLKQIFQGLQDSLATTLSANRQVILHPGTKGDSSELHWLGMLNKYLPARYKAAKAFVIDVDGRLSEQIDVVIFDQQYSPFIFHDEAAQYIPAESVYAAFEIKQSLTKGMLEYAAGKIASVRTLKRTSAPIPHAGGKFRPKEPAHILGGILALDSEWSPPFGHPFKTAITKPKGSSILDMGCCVRYGSFVRERNNFQISGPKDSLLFFFLHLLKRLQAVGTVPALDFDKYLKALKF